ncbi:MAG: SsrA-binding protein SmpB [Alphaproteobacteria bacterium]|nr:SsrA-binding protein SmpB [Alphaproteobacteria bacterium]
MTRKKRPPGRFAALNRKARRDYHIEETFEAGVALAGSEVKSLRQGSANIGDAYAAVRRGELFLMNAYIAEYGHANRLNHEPRRPRKLLMHRREISRLAGSVERKGMTLVPLSVYFSDRGVAKVELGLARGKRAYDKRASEKERDWRRRRARLLREGG